MNLDLTRDQVWKLYGLVAEKAGRLAAAEETAMQGFGGEPWYELERLLRGALDRESE